ncbi:GlsB/YeaQ/YmgE family stress response membrane protein [Candidatus Microgenomates bacterium]|nr:GlsB/YeaQ/YmgE family stress response membrane protein [Candidatus Microgenomates bacterium]
MDAILWIILGGVAGVVASAITKSKHGILADIILGIIGGLVGGFVMNLLGYSGVNGLNLYSLIVSVIGAAILIGIGRIIMV